MKPKNTIKNGILMLLLFVILFLVLYNISISTQIKDIKNSFQEEKIELQNEIDELIKDYTDVVIGNKNLLKRLRTELDKMKNLRDSISKIDINNYKLIRKYRSKIASLERENKKLFIKVDSLSAVNKALVNESVLTSQIINQKDSLNTQLTLSNNTLKAKITTASKINISPIKITAMKERSSGKLTNTLRSRRTDVFQVSFDLLENSLTNPGEKKIYIQLIDSNKKVINPKGNTELKNGNTIQYSDSLMVVYSNKQINLISLIWVNRREINKGNYTASVFVEGNFSGNTLISLK
ncbi:MAG: hypothetical protein ACK5H1_03350 [Tenacibaculum sp.]